MYWCQLATNLAEYSHCKVIFYECTCNSINVMLTCSLCTEVPPTWCSSKGATLNSRDRNVCKRYAQMCKFI